ncbi:retropepsin-like aspartic protease [Rhodococcus aetherivorans]|uniref:retropepsin-like aspartic protease n=1 Tax=Rhodococcus aetherivorans TaxID=191292 RepID=UPI00374E526D
MTINYICSKHQFSAPPPSGSSGLTNRPWVEVTATVGSKSRRVYCLLDTGADDTMLDLGTATALGIIPAHLPRRVTVRFGGGSGAGSTFGLLPLTQLEFAGTVVHVDVLFGNVALPLLGRSAFLASSGLDIGFDQVQWKHT